MPILLHTADWHLGAPQYPQIYRDGALPALLKLAVDHNADAVLCAGDVFDRPNPDQRVKDDLLKFLLQTGADRHIKFIFFVGNHDYTTKAKDYHSLIYLRMLQKRLTNVVVLDTTQGKAKNICGFN